MSGSFGDKLFGSRPRGPRPTGPKRILRNLLRKNETGVNVAPGAADDGWETPPAVTLADGTIVQLWKDGESLKRAFDAIKDAKHRVCFEFYTWANDATGRAFADLLIAKAKQGVRVHCIYDSWGTLGGNDRVMFEELRRAGVRVAEFHPVRPWDCKFSWRPLSRDHRKLVAIDHEFAGIGGLNIADPYAGSWVAPNDLKPVQLWRDTAIGVRGPAARYFVASFAHTWNYVHKGGRIHRAGYMSGIHAPRPAKGNRIGTARSKQSVEEILPADSLGLIATTPTLTSPLRPILYGLLRGARRRIRMTMAYFAPDDELIRELCDAAGRGVKVQLMFGAKSDIRVMVTAARAFYDRLFCNGVEVYERQFVVLHAKTLLVDDIAIVGSTNLDYRSIEFNCEISAIIRNPAFANQLSGMFDHDMKYAKRVDNATWGKRKFIDRATEWAVIRARTLL